MSETEFAGEVGDDHLAEKIVVKQRNCMKNLVLCLTRIKTVIKLIFKKI